MGKLAFVTGSTRGIGRAIAMRLAFDGYAVAVNGRLPSPEADAVVAAIREQGGTAAFFPGDVADPDAVRNMICAVQEQLGDVSLLVNNAGISQQKLLTDITDEEWKRMIAVHVDGAFYMCRAVLPAMIRAHSGCIINISSMWGETGGSCEVHYSTAKAAVIGLTKALAKEIGPAGVRVNCVAPGVIMTDMMRGFDEQTIAALKEETPLMRLGTPEDIAEAVAFLASDQAGFITGQVLSPNGGIVI